MKIKLTNHYVERAKAESGKRTIIRDTELIGFCLRISQSSKVFLCEKRLKGKIIKVTIGSYPAVSVLDARDAAREILSKIERGIDPREEINAEVIKSVTLGHAFEKFIEIRRLKPLTVKDYTGLINRHYSDWLDYQVILITKDMVIDRHQLIGLNSGKTTANRAARVLRSVLNFTIAKYEVNNEPILKDNPVNVISKTKAWNKNNRKTGYLKVNQIKPWFKAVGEIRNPCVRDYFQFVLLTGCRRTEAAEIQWSSVSLDDRTFTILDPKNRNDIELPMSDYVVCLIKNRLMNVENDFVFPAKSASGHIEEPKKHYYTIEKKIGIRITIHDLRRSFITIAESLDISHYALKALVNHSSGNDVTAGYIQMNVERLREPMQRITDYIIEHADIGF